MEYLKVISGIAYTTPPVPEELIKGMSGAETLQGSLTEVHYAKNAEDRAFTEEICLKWNTQYRAQKQR